MRLDGRTYPVHRLIWYYMTGDWPKGDLDHVNGNTADNRWTNLRLATKSQNQGNSRRRVDNASGFKGVCWSNAHRKSLTYTQVNGKRVHLGYFNTPELAALTYAAAAKKYFGEFARPTLDDTVHEIQFGKGKQFEKQVLRNLADLSIYSE